MREAERQELLQKSKKVSEAFRALPTPEKIERLKRIGILNAEGHLAARYGGSDDAGADRKSQASAG